ncbi:CRAL/TRIO domain-containing protein, partial [Schizopora paradoxa]
MLNTLVPAVLKSGTDKTSDSDSTTDQGGAEMPDEPIEMPKLAGHAGRLTQEQEATLATFKSSLQKADLYTPGSGEAKPSHDDATLLRFLRARRFDPVKAQKQFADRIVWQKQHDVDNLFANFPTDEFEDSRRYYPRWTGRRDKMGLPVYVYQLSALTSELQGEMNAVSAERKYQRIVVLYEFMLRFVCPLCSSIPRQMAPTPVSAVTTIIDLSDTSLRQMWNLRSHLQEASELANANYPETLGATVVVNAPAFFPTIWGWIKGWFDANTRDKIHILGKNHATAIASLIEPSELPKQYGGKLDWKFLDAPLLDDEMKKVLPEMPRGPFVFDGDTLTVNRPKEFVPPATTNG